MARFECQVCGTCCRGEGGIYLTREEKDRIAEFLHLPVGDFLARYCIEKNGKTYIHIRDTDGYCHFAVDGRCQIHAVKPAPCRQWPFFPPMLTDPANWPVARHSCPALAPYANLEDYLNGIRSE